MSLNLPVKISAESSLTTNTKLTKQVLEKLEAWINFETLKANWYGDETREVKTTFLLVSQETFNEKLDGLVSSGWIEDLSLHCVYSLSDDLNSCTFMFYPANDDALCQVALEQTLITLLNLAAVSFKLDEIAG